MSAKSKSQSSAKQPRDLQVEQSAPNMAHQFVLVTAKTLARAVQIIKQFQNERRAVAIVFDHYFTESNLKLEVIRSKFEPVFGTINDDQVLIRTNMTRLMDGLDEPLPTDFGTLKQAYIVGEKGLSDQEVNRRAAARDVFCCPMTMGCVINNLRKGVFMMNYDVLLDKENIRDTNGVQSKSKRAKKPTEKGATNQSDYKSADLSRSTLNHQESAPKENDDQPVSSAPRPLSKELKRSNRIAALLDAVHQTTLDSSSSNDSIPKIEVSGGVAKLSAKKTARKLKKSAIAAKPEADETRSSSNSNVERPSTQVLATTENKLVTGSKAKSLSSGNSVLPMKSATVNNKPPKLHKIEKKPVDKVKATSNAKTKESKNVQTVEREQCHKPADSDDRIDSDLYISLRRCGDTVVQLDHLPAVSTITALNLMLGTYSLQPNQVIARRRRNKGRELMDLRIVCSAGDADYKLLLSKNGCPTHCDTRLFIKPTTLDGLEVFMCSHRDKLVRLERGQVLPTTVVGYRNANRCRPPVNGNKTP